MIRVVMVFFYVLNSTLSGAFCAYDDAQWCSTLDNIPCIGDTLGDNLCADDGVYNAEGAFLTKEVLDCLDELQPQNTLFCDEPMCSGEPFVSGQHGDCRMVVGPASEEAIDSLWRIFTNNTNVALTEEQILREQNWCCRQLLPCVNHLIFRKKVHIVYNKEAQTYTSLSTPLPRKPDKHVCVALCEVLYEMSECTFNHVVNILYQKGYAATYSAADLQVYKDCLLIMGYVRGRTKTEFIEKNRDKRKAIFEHVKDLSTERKFQYYRELTKKQTINGNDVRILNAMVYLYKHKILEEVQGCCKRYEKDKTALVSVELLMLQYVKENSPCHKKAFMRTCREYGWAASEEAFWNVICQLGIGSDEGHVEYNVDAQNFSWAKGRYNVPVLQTRPLLALYALCRDYPHYSRHEQVFFMKLQGLDFGRARRMGQLTGIFFILGVVADIPWKRHSAIERGFVRLKMLNMLIEQGALMNMQDYSARLQIQVNPQDIEVLKVWHKYVLTGDLRFVWQSHQHYLCDLQKEPNQRKEPMYPDVNFLAREAPALYSYLSQQDMPDADGQSSYPLQKKQRCLS